MGYVFNFADAIAYDRWLDSQENRKTVRRQTRLMIELLDPVRRESIIDIGCGTGSGLMKFLELGLQVTGVDPSPYMLDIARRRAGHRVELHRCFAEDLPFEDNSFTYGCLNITLEFVENPEKALEEIFRVTKDRVFLGVLNKYAIKGIQRRIKGIFIESIYNRARFFSVWELKQMIRALMGNVPVQWRTAFQLPSMGGHMMEKLEQLEESDLLQRCPFGEFTGIVVTLVPRYEARPLTMRYPANSTAGPVAG